MDVVIIKINNEKEEMKSLKDYKVQILAAMALAFSLGMVVPSAVFASEGGENAEAGIEAQAEGTENEGTDSETLNLNDSVAELYKRIQERDAFADFRKMAPVIANTDAINNSGLMGDAQAWAESFMPYENMGTAWYRLSGETKEAIAGKKIYQVLDVLKADPLYTATYNGTYAAKVNDLAKLDTELKAQQVTLIKAAMPTVTDVDTMTLPMLVGTVEHSENYTKNGDLVTAMMFMGESITDGALSMSKLTSMYQPAELTIKYAGMANAAAKIDPTVTTGLAAYQMPETSKPGGDDKPAEEKPGDKVNTPDTGIVGLLEAGALDLGTLTLIASVAVAAVAGLGLIAKLYLKRKF